MQSQSGEREKHTGWAELYRQPDPGAGAEEAAVGYGGRRGSGVRQEADGERLGVHRCGQWLGGPHSPIHAASLSPPKVSSY